MVGNEILRKPLLLHPVMRTLYTLSTWIAAHITWWVVAVSAVALVLPASFNWIGTAAVTPMLGLVMFGMGLTLNPADFQIVFSRPKDVIIGCLAQFIVMPVLAWLLAKVFHLSPELALGVILVGCCPGGTRRCCR